MTSMAAKSPRYQQDGFCQSQPKLLQISKEAYNIGKHDGMHYIGAQFVCTHLQKGGKNNLQRPIERKTLKNRGTEEQKKKSMSRI